MALSPGTKLGPYEILAPLGSGGMGEVYRARDPKLNRDIALKVLLPAVANDPDRLARFAREAQVLAALNHTNIAHVHGFEDAGDVRALVMELVEGPTLADVIAGRKGTGLPLDETVAVAKQIADALDAAHEQGIVHRDLKPANIKVRPDGTVKVRDFGLAKAMTPSAELGTSAMMSPTISLHATQAGMILGTAAYMSPEQARGRAVDKRADIWAFGCVLYEMLTGTMAFGDEDVSLTLSKVLQREPDWSALPASTPLHVVDLIKRCLRKDPRERLRDIGDARWELGQDAARAISQVAPRKRPQVAVALAGVAAGLLVGALWATQWFRAPNGDSPSPRLSRLSISLPAAESLQLVYYPGSTIAISPDGSEIIYVGPHGGDRLRRRRLGSQDLQTIPGTEGAQQPFFSPTGEWLAFFTDDGSLKKMPARGGRPVIVVRDIAGAAWAAGSWGDTDQIVFDNWANGLSIVGSDGGNRRKLIDGGDEMPLAPVVLPGSRTTLFTVMIGDGSPRIDAVGLDGTGRKTLLENAGQAMYLASGHLLFMRDGDVMAAPFDRERVEISGPVVSLGLNVVVDMQNSGSPVPQLAVAPNGTLVFAAPSGTTARESTLQWVDRAGTTIESFSLPFGLPYFQLSPDDSKLAVMGRRGGPGRITIFDLARKAFSEIADAKLDYPSMPLWSPDGNSLIFAKGVRNQAELWSRRIDGSTPDQAIVKTKGAYWAPGSFSADGRFLVYMIADPATTLTHLRLIDLQSRDPNREQILFPSATAIEFDPAISPDGRWIAYGSDESGRIEVYVRRFPNGDNKTRVSVDGGTGPQWRRDGRELFFTTYNGHPVNKMFAVDVIPGSSGRFGSPHTLFEKQFVSGIDLGRTWAVSRDGKRFLVMPGGSTLGQSSELVVVQNWFDEVRRLAPAQR